MKPARQERLTRVGPGTPMGGLLRRYWHPVAVSSELAAGQARRVRLLGEDLALFRLPDGTPGLVAERCPHRGASLACGRVDTKGLRCPYHGWQFDVAGRCLEMPAEPDSPALRARAGITAYAVEELGGLVFAYLGPEPRPLLPRYDLFVAPGRLRDIGRALLPCNWLQIMENSVDPTHVEWLHGHHLAGERASRGLSDPAHYRQRHERIGFDVFRYGIIKRRVLAGRDETHDDWAVGHPLVFPCMLRVGSGIQHRFQIRVPVDDTHTLHYWYACYSSPAGQPLPPQATIPVYEVPWQDAAGNFLTDFVDGGDVMTWVSQGPIADRTRELLVGSDQGITLLRRLLDEQLEAVADGRDPLGVIRDPAENDCIRFAQEHDKLGGGRDFLRAAVEMSHVRHSPLKDQILALLASA
jgi:5,5'-dehydrodivanillate O-demethylase